MSKLDKATHAAFLAALRGKECALAFSPSDNAFFRKPLSKTGQEA